MTESVAQNVKDGARRKVRHALEMGRMSKPTACEVCKHCPPTARDGRSGLHGHHRDYSKPLWVQWLCAACHRAVTPLNPYRGVDHVNAKLTEQQVFEIRSSTLSTRKLAPIYGVSQTTISVVRRRGRWKHV